jgi:hypothetical protein
MSMSGTDLVGGLFTLVLATVFHNVRCALFGVWSLEFGVQCFVSVINNASIDQAGNDPQLKLQIPSYHFGGSTGLRSE